MTLNRRRRSSLPSNGSQSRQDRAAAAPHQLELSVRRYEADASLRFELAQLDALVEGAVVDCDGRLAAPARRQNRRLIFGRRAKTELQRS